MVLTRPELMFRTETRRHSRMPSGPSTNFGTRESLSMQFKRPDSAGAMGFSLNLEKDDLPMRHVQRKTYVVGDLTARRAWSDADAVLCRRAAPARGAASRRRRACRRRRTSSPTLFRYACFHAMHFLYADDEAAKVLAPDAPSTFASKLSFVIGFGLSFFLSWSEFLVRYTRMYITCPDTSTGLCNRDAHGLFYDA